jgi:hypothetical protein
MSATLTNEGYIPHMLVVTDAGTLRAPVKLQTEADGKIKTADINRNYLPPVAMRREGRLVFALPGGGEVLG